MQGRADAGPVASVRPATVTAENRLLRTLVAEGRAADHPPAGATLDITTLKPGDVIESRYRFIDKIGKGAFGTVLLVEDTVVDERLILKFLNPNVFVAPGRMAPTVPGKSVTTENSMRFGDVRTP